MGMKRRQVELLVLAMTPVIAGVSACGGEDANAGQYTADTAAQADVVQELDIPDAILGIAAPPRGEDLPYFDADSSTVGYIVAPEGEGPFPAVLLIHEWNGLVDRGGHVQWPDRNQPRGEHGPDAGGPVRS